jgi:hypothetical protein
MKKALCAILLTGLIFLPALPVEAKPLNASSSSLEAVVQGMSWILQIKEWLDQANNWFEETLGIDLYNLITMVVGYTIELARTAISLGIKLVAQLRDLLAF